MIGETVPLASQQPSLITSNCASFDRSSARRFRLALRAKFKSFVVVLSLNRTGDTHGPFAATASIQIACAQLSQTVRNETRIRTSNLNYDGHVGRVADGSCLHCDDPERLPIW